MQIKFCNVEYCDFVVYKKDSALFIQRIELDSEFINNAISETKSFIRLGILPELIGRWYTKSRIARKAVGDGSNEVMSSSSTAPVSSLTSPTQDEQQLQASCDLQSDMDDLQPNLTGQLDLDDNQDDENVEEQRDTQDYSIDDKQEDRRDMEEEDGDELESDDGNERGAIVKEMSHLII